MEPSVFVRYCVSGHEIRFSGLCPFSCPVCGGPIDRSKPPVPLEELKSHGPKPVKQEEMAPQKPEPEQRQTEGIQAPPQERRPQNSVEPETPAQRIVQRPEPVPQQTVPVRQPVRSRINTGSAPTGTVLPMRERASASVGRMDSFGEKKTRVPGGKLQLNYLGMTMEIPEDGGWMGREGIGAECFEGNRYISRKHVFVKPDQNGRLIVQEDRSMNGVYYDTGRGRQKLEKGRSVILQLGDMLWLYNIPLKLERNDNE